MPPSPPGATARAARRPRRSTAGRRRRPRATSPAGSNATASIAPSDSARRAPAPSTGVAVRDRERDHVQRAVGGADRDRAGVAARDARVDRDRAHRRAERELARRGFCPVTSHAIKRPSSPPASSSSSPANASARIARARASQRPRRRPCRRASPIGNTWTRERRLTPAASRRPPTATSSRPTAIASSRSIHGPNSVTAPSQRLRVPRAQRGQRLHARLPLALRGRVGELAEHRRDRARELDILERDVAQRLDQPPLRDARRQRALRLRRARRRPDRARRSRPGGRPNSTTRANWRSAVEIGEPLRCRSPRRRRLRGAKSAGHGLGRWRSQNSRTANSRTSRSGLSISHASRSAPPTRSYSRRISVSATSRAALCGLSASWNSRRPSIHAAGTRLRVALDDRRRAAARRRARAARGAARRRARTRARDRPSARSPRRRSRPRAAARRRASSNEERPHRRERVRVVVEPRLDAERASPRRAAGRDPGGAPSGTSPRTCARPRAASCPVASSHSRCTPAASPARSPRARSSRAACAARTARARRRWRARELEQPAQADPGRRDAPAIAEQLAARSAAAAASPTSAFSHSTSSSSPDSMPGVEPARDRIGACAILERLLDPRDADLARGALAELVERDRDDRAQLPRRGREPRIVEQREPVPGRDRRAACR